jgi:hypothetical protein
MMKAKLAKPLIAMAAVLAGLIGSGALIANASFSAFSSTTSNAGNNWSAGTVTLTDDDTGYSMFSTSTTAHGEANSANMKPGQSVVSCVKVTYSGNLASTVKLYATSVTDNVGVSTGMVAYLHVKVEEGTAGAFGSACTGFAGASTIWGGTNNAADLISAFPTTYAAGQASGLASWTNGSLRAYRFTMTVDSSAPDTSQGASASATFNWQAQNT